MSKSPALTARTPRKSSVVPDDLAIDEKDSSQVRSRRLALACAGTNWAVTCVAVAFSRCQVTAIFKHTVNPGCEDAFERWLFRLSAFCKENYQGHLGTDVIHPNADQSQCVRPFLSRPRLISPHAVLLCCTTGMWPS